MKEYPDSGHGFMNDHALPLVARITTAAGFHGPDAEDAWRRIEEFFGRHLVRSGSGGGGAAPAAAPGRDAYMNPMKAPQAWLSSLAHRFDAFQQRHRVLAFPAAIWRELEDQRVNYLTALLTYYAFVSLFPALLILTTVLGAVLRHDPELQERVLNSALVDFPVIGQELKNNIHGIGRNGAGLAIGIVDHVPGRDGSGQRRAGRDERALGRAARPAAGVPAVSFLRSLALTSVLGLAVLTTAVLSGIGEWSASSRFSAGARVLLLAASLATTILLFWLGMRIAVAERGRVARPRDRRGAGRDVLPGAASGSAASSSRTSCAARTPSMASSA